jgi:preprotein translocase subunit YajC
MTLRGVTPQEVESVSFTIIIWIVVFFGIFYFLAIRPQRRQKQQHAEMVSMLKKGDEVVTIGGMYGTISGIGDDWVELEIAKRTRVRYLKRAISSITSIDEYDEDEEDEYIEAADDEVIEEADEYVAYEEEVFEDAEIADDTAGETAGETPDAPDAPEAPKA